MFNSKFKFLLALPFIVIISLLVTVAEIVYRSVASLFSKRQEIKMKAVAQANKDSFKSWYAKATKHL